MEIIRTRDKVKLTPIDIEQIVAEHIEKTTGRKLHSSQFHVSTDHTKGVQVLGAITVELAYENE